MGGNVKTKKWKHIIHINNGTYHAIKLVTSATITTNSKVYILFNVGKGKLVS